MPEFLSLPPELLHEIIQTCCQQERCHLRATCKFLSDVVDPVIFSRLRLHLMGSPLITEHQIISLATRSSKACELTRDMEIFCLPNVLRASEQSRHYFGNCVDLKVHLPTAISMLRNITHLRWVVSDYDPSWLIGSLLQVASRLPHLTELEIQTSNAYKTLIPLGLFSNLSILSVQCGRSEHVSFFVSQMVTVIANSPLLRNLGVTYWGLTSHGVPLPTLRELFAKLSTKNPLRLERLNTNFIDTTVDQVTLPHLTQLTSFQFLVRIEDVSVARRVWTSFLVNNIQLSDVVIGGIITEETMSYLSSFSGLKSLVVNFVEFPSDVAEETLKNMLFSVVLPRHVDSLQTLRILGVSGNEWVFDHSTSKSIMKCLKLHDIFVYIDGEESSMPVQLFLDTVAHLPELKILRFFILDFPARKKELANFIPKQGLRYVEELVISLERYVLERGEGKPVRYRKL